MTCRDTSEPVSAPVLSMRQDFRRSQCVENTKLGYKSHHLTGLDSLYPLMCLLSGLFLCLWAFFFRGQEDRRGPTTAATDGVVDCRERETTVVDLGS